MLLIGLFSLAFLLVPVPAHAMPQLLIPVFIAAGMSATLAAVAAFVVTTAITMAISFAVSALLKPQAKGQTAPGTGQTVIDNKINVRQPTAPRQVIYGEARVGGVFGFMHSNSNNKHLHIVILMAGHEVHKFAQIWIGDEAFVAYENAASAGAGDLVIDANGFVPAPSQYAGKVRVRPFKGAPGQTIDADLLAECSDVLTSADTFAGTAGIYLRLEYDRAVFPGGIPNITAVIQGKKDIYDPRYDTTGWSSNAALIVANYLCDTRYGIGVDYETGIDENALFAAANSCDEQVDLAAGGTEPRYQSHGSFNSNDKPLDILGRLLGAMHGRAPFDGERWRIIAGVYQTPSLSFTDDDLRAGPKIQTLTSRRDRFNAVKGTYIDPARFWQEADFAPVKSTSYAALDGEPIYRDIILPFTRSASTAQRIAKIDLLASRYEIAATMPGKLTLWKAQAGDTVYWTSERYGWTNKPFEVRRATFAVNSSDNTLGVDLELAETGAVVYDWATSEESPVDENDGTDGTDVNTVAPPTNLTVTEEIYSTAAGTGVKSRLLIDWDASVDGFLTAYQVEMKLQSVPDWTQQHILGRTATTETYWTVEDVAAGAYHVRVAAINQLEKRSTFIQVSATTTGDSSPPEDVAGFTSLSGVSGFTTFTWTAPVYERARAGIAEMRFNAATSGVTWASASPIVVQSALNAQAIIQTKIGTYLIKYKSANGIYSSNAASAVITTTQQSKVGIEIVDALPATDLYNGRLVFLTTNGKLYRYTGTAWTSVVPASDITGTVADAQIAALAASKITGQLTDAQIADLTATKISGQLTNAQIAAIDAAKITTGQLTDAQIAAISAAKLTGQITTTQITDSAISAAKIAAGSITTAKIAAGAVTANEIGANAITAAKISAGAVETAAIAAGAIQADKIAASSVTATAISAGAIITAKIAAGAVTANEIGANAITAAKISAGAVETAAIAAGAIQADKIAASAVTADKIAANAVTATQIAANAITADKITAGAVTAAKISVSQLSAMSADLGTVTAGTITGLTIQTASSGARSVMDGSRTMIRAVDDLYTTRTYYRALSGVTEQNIVANMGADSVGGVPTGYIRAIGYTGGHGIDGIALGNTSTPNSTPNAQGVTGLGDFCGLTGVSGYIGVIGTGGTWDFYADGAGSNYGPFTGTHDAVIDKTHAVEVGDIVIDVALVAQKSISNAITRVEVSSAANQPGALGVVSGRDELHTYGPPAALAGPRAEGVTYDTIADEHAGLIETHDRLRVNAIGEGLINVCGQGGNIAIGDLIVTSDTAGKGMKQADNIVRGITVAKAREAATFATPGEVKIIACIYVSG